MNGTLLNAASRYTTHFPAGKWEPLSCGVTRMMAGCAAVSVSGTIATEVLATAVADATQITGSGP